MVLPLVHSLISEMHSCLELINNTNQLFHATLDHEKAAREQSIPLPTDTKKMALIIKFIEQYGICHNDLSGDELKSALQHKFNQKPTKRPTTQKSSQRNQAVGHQR